MKSLADEDVRTFYCYDVVESQNFFVFVIEGVHTCTNHIHPTAIH